MSKKSRVRVLEMGEERRLGIWREFTKFEKLKSGKSLARSKFKMGMRDLGTKKREREREGLMQKVGVLGLFYRGFSLN